MSIVYRYRLGAATLVGSRIWFGDAGIISCSLIPFDSVPGSTAVAFGASSDEWPKGFSRLLWKTLGVVFSG
jgi:hypothetical protein